MVSMTSTDLGLTVAFSVIVLINLLGNGLVCLVVFQFRGMRAPINYLLVNLAVSDMMVALGITPQYVVRWAFHHPNGTAGDYMCTFVTGGNFIWVGQAASTFSLVVVAVERYYAIVRPFNDHSGLTKHRLIGMITASWIYALIFDLPLFFVVRHKDGISHCIEQWPNKQLAKGYTMACFFVFGVVPVGAMTFLYSKVLWYLWKDGERTPLLAEQTRIRARQKVTNMVLIVSVIYAACRLPNLVLYMLSQYKPELYLYGSDSYVTTVVLVGLNSAINPFIYALHSTNFRQHFRGTLSCKSNITQWKLRGTPLNG